MTLTNTNNGNIGTYGNRGTKDFALDTSSDDGASWDRFAQGTLANLWGVDCPYEDVELRGSVDELNLVRLTMVNYYGWGPGLNTIQIEAVPSYSTYWA